MYSPSDEFAWGDITEGSDQVSQSEILSISIIPGCKYWWTTRLIWPESHSASHVWRMNEA